MKTSTIVPALILILVAAGVAVRLLATRSSSEPAAASRSGLDLSRWAKVSDGDFEEAVVDGSDQGSRLRLRAATRGTRDDTVKFLGARSVKTAALGPGGRVAARLDWNNQANGSYLSGALILSPQETAANPVAGPDWFKVEYIGVPPGQNARLLIANRVAGRERFLQTEGWPEANRQGRKIGLVEIEIVLEDPGVRVLENGREVFASKERLVPFGAARVYLQMSTHSNYPPREIFFDRVRFPGGP